MYLKRWVSISFIFLAFLTLISTMFFINIDSNIMEMVGSQPAFYLINASALLIIMSIFFMGEDKKKKEEVPVKKPVTKITLNNMTIDVSLLIPEIYDSLKKVEGIVDESIYFYKEKNGYLIEIDAEVKKGVGVSKIKEEVEGKLKEFLINEYKLEETIPTSFTFKEVSIKNEEIKKKKTSKFNEEDEESSNKTSDKKITKEKREHSVEETKEELKKKKRDKKQDGVDESEQNNSQNEKIENVEKESKEKSVYKRKKKPKRMTLIEMLKSDDEDFKNKDEVTLDKLKKFQKEISKRD